MRQPGWRGSPARRPPRSPGPRRPSGAGRGTRSARDPHRDVTVLGADPDRVRVAADLVEDEGGPRDRVAAGPPLEAFVRALPADPLTRGDAGQADRPRLAHGDGARGGDREITRRPRR